MRSLVSGALAGGGRKVGTGNLFVFEQFAPCTKQGACPQFHAQFHDTSREIHVRLHIELNYMPFVPVPAFRACDSPGLLPTSQFE